MIQRMPPNDTTHFKSWCRRSAMLWLLTCDEMLLENPQSIIFVRSTYKNTALGILSYVYLDYSRNLQILSFYLHVDVLRTSVTSSEQNNSTIFQLFTTLPFTKCFAEFNHDCYADVHHGAVYNSSHCICIYITYSLNISFSSAKAWKH